MCLCALCWKLCGVHAASLNDVNNACIHASVLCPVKSLLSSPGPLHRTACSASHPTPPNTHTSQEGLDAGGFPEALAALVAQLKAWRPSLLVTVVPFDCVWPHYRQLLQVGCGWVETVATAGAPRRIEGRCCTLGRRCRRAAPGLQHCRLVRLPPPPPLCASQLAGSNIDYVNWQVGGHRESWF